MVGFHIERTGILDVVAVSGYWTLHLPVKFLMGHALGLSCLLTSVQLTGGCYLNGAMLLSALSMALIYTFAQEDPNRQVHFFIVQIPAKFLPYASLTVTFLVAGPVATMIQATGIIAAHCYDFFDRVWPQFGGGKRYTQTPQVLQKWFATIGGAAQARTYGTSFAARPGGPGQPSTPGHDGGSGWSSGSAWNSRGAGRRLGGE